MCITRTCMLLRENPITKIASPFKFRNCASICRRNDRVMLLKARPQGAPRRCGVLFINFSGMHISSFIFSRKPIPARIRIVDEAIFKKILDLVLFHTFYYFKCLFIVNISLLTGKRNRHCIKRGIYSNTGIQRN